MSYDVEANWFYYKKGRKLHLYMLRKGSFMTPDSQGRLSSVNDTLLYPDEAITNGLRIEYTKINTPFITEDPEVDTTETEVTGTNIDENSHINLNRMLSLAVVSFIRGKIAERNGDIQTKEYYMRDFWKKVADNKSNMKKVHIVLTQPVFNLR
jgi:hypothetical protein